MSRTLIPCTAIYKSINNLESPLNFLRKKKHKSDKSKASRSAERKKDAKLSESHASSRRERRASSGRDDERGDARRVSSRNDDKRSLDRCAHDSQQNSHCLF